MADYDVLVIGAGMAGCILATRVAENGVNAVTGSRLRVGLLERGPYFKGDPRPGYGIPLRRRMFTNISHEFRQGGRYSMGIFPGIYDLKIQRATERPRGLTTTDTASIVGGSSLHWDAKTQVPMDLDYEAWAEETGVDWTAENFRAASDEILRLFNIHPRPDPLLSRGDLLFRSAAESLGLQPIGSALAKKNCIGCGFCNSADMCKYDAKMGPLITHLPLAEWLGVEIIPEAEAERLVLEKVGARAVVSGALFRYRGSSRGVTANKVVVCCGSFGTPLLLFRSGYGRRDVLGSNLIVQNENIGRNMDAKPGPPALQGIFRDPVTDGDYHDGGFYVYQDVHPRGYTDRVEIGSGGAGGWRSPDLWALGGPAPEFGREHKEFMRQVTNPAVATAARTDFIRRINLSSSLVRPREVRGSIDASGRFEYQHTHPGITRRLNEARELAHEILKAMGAEEVLNPRLRVQAGSATMQMSSCRAGADRASSVVNSDFESHDVDGLFICDGSTMPREASHGYGAPVATLATYAAQRIVANHFSEP